MYYFSRFPSLGYSKSWKKNRLIATANMNYIISQTSRKTANSKKFKNSHTVFFRMG